ncbi:MAG: hypothetical protein MUP85_25575 [Candidatus Lokiarchaeota archaeon]|nr:hypothetical protein [Candidatus Lokiarchaeota archaeon]
MNLKFDDQNLIKKEFTQKLIWFEEEFDMIFKNKTHNYTKNDLTLANEILDKLSEAINEYRNEKLLFDLVSTLNNIEKKHPEFF